MPSIDAFGTEIIRSKSGTWFEITTLDQAKLATKATHTAIAHFFQNFAEQAPHRWFYLVEDVHADQPKSPICLAAVTPDLADQGRIKGVDACHVTGYANKNSYFDYEEDLQTLAEATGIYMVPNFMGRLIRHSTEMDTKVNWVSSILAANQDERLADFLPDGLTLETHNWETMQAIRILDGNEPIAFLLDKDEFGIHRVEVPDHGLELAVHKLGGHPREFFELLETEARHIEIAMERESEERPGM